MSKVLSAYVPDEVSQAIEDYAVKLRLSKSHVTREIIIGELDLKAIKKEVSKK